MSDNRDYWPFNRQVANTLVALFGIGFKIHNFLLLTVCLQFYIFFINDRDQFGFRINHTTGKVQQLMSSKNTEQDIPNLYRLRINLTDSQFFGRDSFSFRTVLTAVHNEHCESNLRKFTTIVNIWLLCFQVSWDISECGTADTDRHSCCTVPLITALLTIEAQ